MKIIASLGLFALAACAPADEEASKQAAPEAPAVELTKECNASAGQYAVGKPFTDALAAELKTKVGANSVRIVPPDTAVTMDYRGDRLNIIHDGKKIITKVDCG